MNKIACWATNSLDVDVAWLYYGYGSRYDLTTQTYGYWVSLEGAKCLAKYDFDYLDDVLNNICRVCKIKNENLKEKLSTYYLGYWDKTTTKFDRKDIIKFLYENFSPIDILKASPVGIDFLIVITKNP